MRILGCLLPNSSQKIRIFDATREKNMKFLVSILLSAAIIPEVGTAHLPPTVILDEDFSTDVDDVLAVRMATKADKLGYINLACVGLSCSNYNASRAMHGLLSYDGYSDIPIGTCSEENVQTNDYWGELWGYGDENTLIQCNSVDLYKNVLSKSDTKVKIVTTGYLYNIANLLKDKDGYELVKTKCDSIWITGGSWKSGMDNNFYAMPKSAESIRYVINHSPVPLVFSTSNTMSIKEEYRCIMTGDTLNSSDPVDKALKKYGQVHNFNMDNGYYSWDNVCVFAACYPFEVNQMHLTPCNIYVAPNGANTFDLEGNFNCQVIERNSNDLTWYEDVINSYMN